MGAYSGAGRIVVQLRHDDGFVSVVIMHSGAIRHSDVVIDNTAFVSYKKRW
jgi:hypothetical protein